MAGHVFVSYRTEDKVAAERICLGLEREKIQCWIAPRNIPAGREWATAIVEGIQSCNAFVMVLSSNSKNAKQISREAELADRQGIPIITFRIEDVQPPPGLMYFLGNIQWLDGFGSQFDAAIGQLVQLARALPDVATEPAVSAAPSAAEVLRGDPRVPAAANLAATASAAAAAPARENAAAISEVAKASPAQIPAGNASLPWLKIGAGVAVLLVLGFVLLHRTDRDRSPRLSSDARTVPRAEEPRRGVPARAGAPERTSLERARAVAERFLDERDSGNLDAAWNEYAPGVSAQGGRSGWEQRVRGLLAHGRPQHEFNGCKPNEAGFVCAYLLRFPDGATSNQFLQLVREGDDRWVIEAGNFTPIH